MDTRLVIGVALLVTAAGCSSGDAEEVPPPTESETAATTAATEEAPGPSGLAGAWSEVPDALGTREWTNKVEVADLDLDGDVDLLFANGGNYDSPGRPLSSWAFLNEGDATFVDRTRRVFGDRKALARVVKVADVNGDGLPDVVLGTTYQTQSRLYLGTGRGWEDATRQNFPAAQLSVGDLEVGDVDGDGDLDLVLADWGYGNPLSNAGSRAKLWLNDGAGRFTDATADHMPETSVRFSWDLELVDIDNDWDLDLAVSCKSCPTSLLYVNDGSGHFADETAERLPAFSNNYDFAPLDLDGDGFLDLVTVNDGVERAEGLTEHVFHNDGTGHYADVTDDWWPEAANPGYDDNVVVGLDVESDGDADFLIGSLDGPDRLLVNDGSGHLSLADDVFDATGSPGTLGLALADLDGDGRVDVAEAQGELQGGQEERVYLATDVLAPDTAPPVVRAAVVGGTVLARVHDNHTPYLAARWRSVAVRWASGRSPMTWYGEHLFSAAVPRDARDLEVCATDVGGNRTCVPVE